MSPDPQRLPRLLATVGRSDLAAHVGHWGPRPSGDHLLTELARSGLTGRGGAGFPAAVKWEAARRSRATVVVANGTEGEPASNKDKTLLIHAPHLVLDGASLAAEAIGATEAVICVDQSASTARRSVHRAISERIHYGQDRVALRVEATPPGYITGEESALVAWLSGGRALPTFGRRPDQSGVDGRPTLVNNVETLANAALIARFGADWFAAVGTAESPGTALITVSGDVSHPAVYEVPFGTRIADIITRAGPTSRPQAALIGGYAGTWFGPADCATAPLEASARSGVPIGCGSILVVGEASCGLKATAEIANWMAGESAGQCGPCANGLPAIAAGVSRLLDAASPQRAAVQTDRWLAMVEGRGACKHPDGTVRMVRSGLCLFADEVDRHRRHGDCRRPAPPLPLPRYDGAVV
ncbi:MAG TPA: NADH-ubiquinone oxidoreductase-F iron-sulfur binding region domain-containing protein [Acidimicrobiales bacterium]|jgi:NADH:ubiquinone oxidoreductase subunit F (NADH-binding)|nr:NADH-ubiquinone oxidoreductase-F iron-sulfur binding region domain-containing protein [Acidimicrobiales bacterium]